MTLAMKLDESKVEGIAIGEKKGSQRKAFETAKIALQKNLDLDLIVALTGLSIDEINALKQEQ